MWSQVQTSPLAPALRLGLRPNSQLTRPSQGSHTKGKFWDTTLCTMASVGFPLGSAPCPHSCWEQCGAGRCAPILPCLHPLGSRAWLENTWVWSQPQGEKEEKKNQKKEKKEKRRDVDMNWIWIEAYWGFQPWNSAWIVWKAQQWTPFHILFDQHETETLEGRDSWSSFKSDSCKPFNDSDLPNYGALFYCTQTFLLLLPGLLSTHLLNQLANLPVDWTWMAFSEHGSFLAPIISWLTLTRQRAAGSFPSVPSAPRGTRRAFVLLSWRRKTSATKKQGPRTKVHCSLAKIVKKKTTYPVFFKIE